MGRLYDAGQEQKTAAAAAQSREDVRRRAEEADKALREAGFLDNAADLLGAQLKVAQAVHPIRYENYRRPGSRWVIEHARDGQDYVFQLFPLKPPTVELADAISMMIAAMDVIFPRSVQIKYTPPNEQYQVKFFTIRIEKITAIPGWEAACRDRALPNLAAIDAWPAR